eukprot:CAMPEP_0185553822 /NCGR_PEP_ID=MMETSP1381-20130426/39300_1 /TAXON_ID=298111 /ORGANISM="Pavlova sp., Strain CCMP459" /LENGTH=198 /DNA_ID=CAMNT_0028166965 /DNA_START=198 /DNA_END=792 /DNA_ORIENTATION=+
MALTRARRGCGSSCARPGPHWGSSGVSLCAGVGTGRSTSCTPCLLSWYASAPGSRSRPSRDSTRSLSAAVRAVIVALLHVTLLIALAVIDPRAHAACVADLLRLGHGTVVPVPLALLHEALLVAHAVADPAAWAASARAPVASAARVCHKAIPSIEETRSRVAFRVADTIGEVKLVAAGRAKRILLPPSSNVCRVVHR